MQGQAGLPVHYRTGSGRGKGGRLSPGRAQLLAFVAFLGLLSVYVAYNIRALLATAAANRERRAREASIAQPIPEPEHQAGWVATVPSSNLLERQAAASAVVAPAVASDSGARQAQGGAAAGHRPPGRSFGAWKGGRRVGPQPGGIVSPAGRASAAAAASAPAVPDHVAIQVRDPAVQHGSALHVAPGSALALRSSDASPGATAAAATADVELKNKGDKGSGSSISRVEPMGVQRTVGQRATRLLAELQAHHRRACRDVAVPAGSVTDSACTRLGEAIGALLGSAGPRLVPTLQQQSFALIELVRQSIGMASTGSELASTAVAVMKELSALAHMRPEARGGLEGDEFLDAHVGSHFEDDVGRGNASLHSGAQRGGTVQQLVQGASLVHQQEQREALHAHQHIPVGAVGRNQALLGSVGRNMR